MQTLRPFRLSYLFIIIVLVSACGGDAKDESSSESRATPQGLENPTTTSAETNPASVLNAGEIDDSATWLDYQDYRNAFLSRLSDLVHDVDSSERHTVRVTDQQGLPILGARVIVYGGQDLITESRTDSAGTTRFYPSAWTATADHQSLDVTVQSDQTAARFTLNPGETTEWHVELEVTRQNDRIPLDVVFLLDATGSMSDEIGQLQDNILAISSQIADLPAETNVRYGLVTYRDRGDEYVTQNHDFVSDVGEFQETLNGVVARGGGDRPESVNEALHVAVQDLSWRGDDAIKLIFLVADAEPHLDYEDDYDYVYEMIAAAWHGIKIYPIASSGLSPTGEFIFRQIAQYTGGHFLFLTYERGTSGAAGDARDDLEAGDANFTVAYLDDLVLNLITNEIAAVDVPVVSSGIEPRLSTTEIVARHTMPEKLSLQTSLSAGQRAYEMSELGEASNALTVSEKLNRAIMVLSGIVAVFAIVPLLVVIVELRSRRRLGKRKRKNEELWLGSWD